MLLSFLHLKVMPKIVNAGLKALAYGQAKAIKMALAPWGQGLASKTTSLSWGNNDSKIICLFVTFSLLAAFLKMTSLKVSLQNLCLQLKVNISLNGWEWVKK